MREGTARRVALGTGVLVLAAATSFGALRQGKASPPAEGSTDLSGQQLSPQVPDSILLAGRAVYDREECSACHAIAGEGSPRSPLDGVGSRLNSDEIRLWIVDPQAARPGIRKPAFDNLETPDLEALVAYIQSLTAA